MTATEKSQVSIKFFVEIVSIILLFGGMFGTYRVTEWRVSKVEEEFTTHYVEHKSLHIEVADIAKKQVQVMTNQGIILEAIKER